jgi:hypothetical protein
MIGSLRPQTDRLIRFSTPVSLLGAPDNSINNYGKLVRFFNSAGSVQTTIANRRLPMVNHSAGDVDWLLLAG